MSPNELISYSSNPATYTYYKTEVLKDRPSKLIHNLQKDKAKTFAICYPLETIDSYIKYYLEIDGSEVFDNDPNPIYDYGILALYTTAQNKHLLIDLDNDMLDINFEKDIQQIDKILQEYQVVNQISKHDLVNFVGKENYLFSNGFNAHDQFSSFLQMNREDDKVTEVNNVINSLLKELPR